MLKQEYFRRFPEDCVIEGCVEVEGGKDGRKGRRKQGEEVDWYRCVRFFRFTSTLLPPVANGLVRSGWSAQRLLLPLRPQVLGSDAKTA